MSDTPLNIISPKALEKQLKAVEGRMQVLQAEMADLEKIKEACHILMGGAELSPSATPKKRSKKEAASTEKNGSEEQKALESAEPPESPESSVSLN